MCSSDLKKKDYNDSSKLYYAAFLETKKNNKLVTNIYFESSYSGKYIDENDKEEELIDDVLDLVKYKTRKHINRR